MQASSLDELASGLTKIFKDGLQQAANQASQQPERFSQIIKDAMAAIKDEAEKFAAIPGQFLEQIKNSAKELDWLGLLLFLAVQLRDAVEKDPPLRVSAWDPGDNWSPALILIYTPQPPVNDVEFRLSIALGGDGTNGIIIEARGAPDFEIPASLLVFAARGTGDGKWRLPFSGGGSGPAVGATLGLDLALAQPILPGGGAVSLGVGIPKVSGKAKVGTDDALNWQVDVSFGTEAAPGLHAKLDLTSFLGALATVVQLQPINERYSPTLRLSSNQAPAFDIGHESG